MNKGIAVHRKCSNYHEVMKGIACEYTKQNVVAILINMLSFLDVISLYAAIFIYYL